MSVCTHPREEFTTWPAGVKNNCPQCRERICLVCLNIAPESWMSGRCHACYRTTEDERRKRAAEWAEEARLRDLVQAWEEGAEAYATRRARDESLPLINPYRERLQELKS